MPPKTERIKVEVVDSTEGETRKFTISLTAPNADFQLTDLLLKRGVISPLDGDLKQAVKMALQNYLSGAETLISTLTPVSAAAPESLSKRARENRRATGTSQVSEGSRTEQRNPAAAS